MNKAATLFLLALGLIAAGDAEAALRVRLAPISPKESADTLARKVCSTCHGFTGNSALRNVPNLAGQQKDYLARQLREFRAQTRSDRHAVDNMWAVSHDLTDRQIDDLAARFAAQNPEAQAAEGRPEQIAAGEKIFNGGALAEGVPPCAGCHGNDAAGKPLFPRLAGQHTDYLVKQLMVFQRTDQRPRAAAMKSVSHDLTPEGMLDVAAYLQALPARAMP